MIVNQKINLEDLYTDTTCHQRWKYLFLKCQKKLCSAIIIILIIIFTNFGAKGYQVSGEKSCNRTRIVLSSSWGRISDGPNDYPKESHCEWLVQAPSTSHYISLNITSMDTECSYDHLYVYDGASYDSYLLAVFSGKSYPALVVAESGAMLILLYSDTNYMRAGFEAEYMITECPLNCSSKGKCVNNRCECDDQYSGNGCEIELCPENCGAPERRGSCVGTQKTSTFCRCEDEYTGDSCSLKGTSAKGDTWHWIHRNGNVFKSRTSHGTVYFPHLDRMYIYGGYNLNKVFDDLVVYNFTDGNWSNLKHGGDSHQSYSSRKRRLHSHRRSEILPSLQLFFDQNEHLKTKEASRSHNMTFSVNSNNTVSVKLMTASDFPGHRTPRMIQPNNEDKYQRQRKQNVWPASRFGHCMESFGSEFVSYGGKLENGKASAELWFYNTSLGEWRLISDSNSYSSEDSSSSPPPLVYCTLTLVDEEWLYLFGGGHVHGQFSNSMYRINPYRGWVWEKVEAYGGNSLKARLVGHSTVFHSGTRSLYIYGGIKVNIARFSKLSDQLLVFNIDRQYWSEIHYPKGSDNSQYFPSPLERAFHSALIAGNYMVIYGGYMHKHKEEEACYDHKIYLFHLGCHVWLSPELIPSQEKDEHLRSQGVYGHSSFLRHRNTIIITGGFHGTVTNHVLAYVLPSTLIAPEGNNFSRDEACLSHEAQSSCVSNLECGWCPTDKICYDRSKSANCTTNLQTSACPGLCPTLYTCQSCVAQGTNEMCGWCVKARACHPRDSTTLGQRSCGGAHHQQGWWGTKDQLITNIEECVANDIPPGLTFMQYKGPVNYSQPDYVGVVNDIGKDLRRPSDSREPQELQTGFLSEFRLKGFLHPQYMEYISANKLYQGMEPIRLFLEGYKLNATLHLSTDDSIENLQKVATIVAGKIPSSEATRIDGEPLIPSLTRLLLQLDIIPIQLSSNSSFNLSLLWSLGSSHPSSLSVQQLEPYGKGGSSCFNYSSCLSCLSDYLCSWCSPERTCIPRNDSSNLATCSSKHFPIVDTTQCEQCEDFIYCNECIQTGYCEWLVEKAHCTRKGRYQNAVKELSNCPIPCHSRRTCAACLGEPGLCAWCEATKECFLFSLYTSVYQYGACRVWIDEDHTNTSSIHQSAKLVNSLRTVSLRSLANSSAQVSSFFSDDVGECQICESHMTCSSCLKSLGCGWCFSNFNPTIGLCTSGDFSNPHKGTCSVLMENISVPSTKNLSSVEIENRQISWTYSSCPDVDECMLEMHDCHSNATCVNTDGGYNCSCPRGFTGNGRTTCTRTCFEICVHGKCSGNPGYVCECNLGWTGPDCSINCGCNNHSKCQRVGVCEHCQGETTGESCELCRPGSYGNATTVGCKKCECNGHWDEERGRCNQTTGRCYCIHNTRGHKCDKCEEGFYGDPRNNGKCYRQCTSRGIIVNATSGYFGSQSSSEEPLDTCLWILSAHNTINPPLNKLQGYYILQVTVESIDIDCEEGALYIYEGLPDFVSVNSDWDRQNLIGTFCTGHASYPAVAEAASGVMTIFYEMRVADQGFTASYRVLGCPDNPGENRNCVMDKPTCGEGWRGVQCGISVCPNKCSEGKGGGRCDVVYGRCICNENYVGEDCSIIREDHLVVLQELFNPLKISSSLSHLQTVLPRFGHTLIVDHQGSLWVFGGYSLSRGPLNDIQQFDTRNKTWVQVTVNVHPGAQPPSQRYFHASAYVNSKNVMYVYGGLNKTHFLKDFWKFNIATESWELLPVIENLPALAGHTLTWRGETTPHSLILIGGVGAEYGLLEEVWEYDLLRFNWQKIDSGGAKPVGILGHSSVYHEPTRSFYAYGGYSFLENKIMLNPYLYVFDYSSKRWSILPPDEKINHNPASRPAPRAFHAAVTTEEYMVLIGGYISDRLNSNQDLMVYSYKCNMWIPLNNHFITVAGHQLTSPLLGVSATLYESSIYLIGGFSGTAYGTVVEITIPEDLCTLNANKTQCRDRIGCANCVVYNSSGTNTSYCYSNMQSEPSSCLRPHGKLTSVKGIQCDAVILEDRECYQYKTCAECLAYWPAHKNAKQRCQWCLTCPKGKCIPKNGNCLKETSCPTPFKYLQTGPLFTTDLAKCPELICGASDCEKCLDLGHCSWAQRRSLVLSRTSSSDASANLVCVKQSMRNASSEESGWITYSICPKRCHIHRSCKSCLETDVVEEGTASIKCHWSPTLRKCLSLSSIPLQCLGGTCGHLLSKNTQCPPPCTSYTQCNQCLSQAQCGWCAIDTNVGGLGICTEGRLEEPRRGRCLDINYDIIVKNQTLLSLHDLNAKVLVPEIKQGLRQVSWHYGNCPPENECLNRHHVCNAVKEVCVDREDGYDCACASGFNMSEDGNCQPVCSQGCKYGNCIEPNICLCDFGYVDFDCSVRCQCNGHSNCAGPDQLTTCLECHNNTMGAQCQRCQKNFVGNPQKNEKCKSCQEYCYSHTNLCTSKEIMDSLNISENIISIEEINEARLNEGPLTDAVCFKCSNMTEGPRCNMCLPGYFRGTTNRSTPCRPCQCNGHGSICDRDWGTNCDCKNNTETPCNGRMRGGVPGKDDDKDCWMMQCSKCKESYFGNPTEGHQCYRQMTLENEYCLDPITQNECHSMPSPLPKGQTIFFAVQPKFNNVDIRLFIDISQGGVDVYFTTFAEGFVVSVNESAWIHQVEIDPSYPIVEESPPPPFIPFEKSKLLSPRYDLIGASAYLSKLTAQRLFTNHSNGVNRLAPQHYKHSVKADGLKTYFTLYNSNHFLVVKNLTDRLVVTLPKQNHNLSEAKFYVVLYGVGAGADSESFGAIYFRQDQPRIDLFVFFSVFFSCFFLFLAVCVVVWKIKQGVDQRRARRRHVVEMLHMAKRPFSTTTLVLHVSDLYEGGSVLTDNPSDQTVWSPGRRKKTQKRDRTFDRFEVGPIAVEPTDDGVAAVVTIVIQMPGVCVGGTGGGIQSSDTPSQRLALGSSLCLVSRIYPPTSRPFQLRRRASHLSS